MIYLKKRQTTSQFNLSFVLAHLAHTRYLNMAECRVNISHKNECYTGKMEIIRTDTCGPINFYH